MLLLLFLNKNKLSFGVLLKLESKEDDAALKISAFSVQESEGIYREM